MIFLTLRPSDLIKTLTSFLCTNLPLFLHKSTFTYTYVKLILTEAIKFFFGMYTRENKTLIGKQKSRRFLFNFRIYSNLFKFFE